MHRHICVKCLKWMSLARVRWNRLCWFIWFIVLHAESIHYILQRSAEPCEKHINREWVVYQFTMYKWDEWFSIMSNFCVPVFWRMWGSFYVKLVCVFIIPGVTQSPGRLQCGETATTSLAIQHKVCVLWTGLQDSVPLSKLIWVQS